MKAILFAFLMFVVLHLLQVVGCILLDDQPSLPLAYNPDWIVIMSDNLKWVLYILECCDGTLYTGISNDVERRLSEHQNGRGAKYTRGRRPVKLVYFEEYVDRSDASKREMEIKRMSRATKLLLADSQTKEI